MLGVHIWCQMQASPPNGHYRIIMPPPLIGGDIKRCFRLTSDVCLSVTYIGPNSRTDRPRKTKIGTEVAYITRD